MPKPNLDTPQITAKLESVRQLEKTLYVLGIEPGSYGLQVRSFTTLQNVAYTCLPSFNCLYSYANLWLTLI